MVFGEVIQAGANPQRNGNMYDAATGKRLTALNPEGAPTPEMEVWSFPTYDALVKAQEKYNGYVVAIMLSGTHVEPWMQQKDRDNGPMDYFKEQPDRSFARSDKWGNIDTELRDRKPDHSGVVATGEVGPGQTTPTTTPTPTTSGNTREFTYSGTLPAYDRLHAYGLTKDNAVVIQFTIGASKYADKIAAVEANNTAPTVRHVRVSINGDAVAGGDYDIGTSTDGLTFGQEAGGAFGRRGDHAHVEITSPSADGPCDMDIDVHGEGR